MRRRRSILNIPHPPKSVMEKARDRLETFTTWPEYEFFPVNKFWVMVVSMKKGHKNAVLHRVRHMVTDFSNAYAVYDSELYPAQYRELQNVLDEDWKDQLAASRWNFSPEQLEAQEERIQNLIDFQGVAL